MSDLIRLTYASKATSEPSTVQTDLIDILNHSRSFNNRHSISGVLFYNNNYFFQCLEGERTQLVELYNSIAKDTRHSDIVQLAREDIDAPAFGQWQMKYVLEDNRIRHFFVTHYGQAFNPYLLNNALLGEFIQLLVSSPEAVQSNTDFSAHNLPLSNKKPVYASSNFAWFVIMPLIIICLFMYVFF